MAAVANGVNGSGSPQQNGTASNGNGVAGAGGSNGKVEDAEVSTVCGRLTAKNSEDSYIGGWKDGAPQDAEFCFPNGLALGRDKSLYVSDSDNRRIRKVDLKTGRVTTWAGGGGTGYLETRNYEFADSAGEHARFGEVRGIAIDAKDNLYVADMFHYRIRKVSPDAEVSTFAGQNKSKPSIDPAQIAAAQAHGTPIPTPDPNEQFADGPAIGGAKFNRPSAVAIDKNTSNVFVCDFSNNRIRKVAPDGTVTTYAGSGEKGYKDGPATEAAFNWPNHIAIDKHGNLYVAEAENYRIRKINASQLIVSTYAGAGKRGFEDGPAADAKFDGPNAVACDADGFVYVTEDENHRVRLISPNGVVRTLAGNGDRGEVNAPTALSSSFAMPTGLIVDPDTGHLYVCDYGNHLIRKIHARVVNALKASMLKEEGGRFPPMPQIDEEGDDKEEGSSNSNANHDPVSTNSQSGNGAGAAVSAVVAADALAEGGEGGPKSKKDKKKSKSKKREKTEQSDEGKPDSKTEESVGGSSSASRKSSASANGAAADGSGSGAGAGKADAGKDGAAEAPKDDDSDNKSCRMCQNKNGCFIM